MFVSVALPACTTPKRAAAVKWTKDDVVGLTIDLIDPVDLWWMSFDKNGIVSVTLGKKNGEIAAPAWNWRVIDGRLQIVVGDEIVEELTLVSRDTSTIVARRRNGQIGKYKIQVQLNVKRIPM